MATRNEIKYAAAAEYLPIHADEITVNFKDVVIILHSYDDGWVLGKNETTNTIGLLPRNFLIPLTESDNTLKKLKKTASERISSLLMKVQEDDSEKFNWGELEDLNMNVDALKLSSKKQETSSFSILKKKFDDMNKWRMDRARVASNIGTLKVCVAGDSGIGKTTLIKTFSQIPEASSYPVSVMQTTPLIQEIKFSTIPQNEIRENEDPYNLTFVDISGYGQHPDAALTIRPAIEYCLGQFQKTDRVFVKGVPIPNLVRFLNAGTGSHTHVDVCVYAILHRLKPIDIEYMRVLSPYTYIIPVLIKSDTLTTDQIFITKKQILQQCNAAGIQIYGFGLDFDELCRFADERLEGTVPFAVNGKDKGGEFECFKQNLLYWHVDDLRQASADKFLNWRNGNKK